MGCLARKHLNKLFRFRSVAINVVEFQPPPRQPGQYRVRASFRRRAGAARHGVVEDFLLPRLIEAAARFEVGEQGE